MNFDIMSSQHLLQFDDATICCNLMIQPNVRAFLKAHYIESIPISSCQQPCVTPKNETRANTKR